MSDPNANGNQASVIPAYITAGARWAVTNGGALLAAHGMLITKSDSELWIGVLSSLGMLGWSWYQKRLTAKRLAAAASAPMSSTTPAVPK